MLTITLIAISEVRPLAGAGIEIIIDHSRNCLGSVRPLAGAGIEIVAACI